MPPFSSIFTAFVLLAFSLWALWIKLWNHLSDLRISCASRVCTPISISKLVVPTWPSLLKTLQKIGYCTGLMRVPENKQYKSILSINLQVGFYSSFGGKHWWMGSYKWASLWTCDFDMTVKRSKWKWSEYTEQRWEQSTIAERWTQQSQVSRHKDDKLKIRRQLMK